MYILYLGAAGKATTAEKVPPATTVAIKSTKAIAKTAKANTKTATISTTKAAIVHSTNKPHGPMYTRGCLTLLKPGFYAAGGIGIFVLFLEITVMAFACLLYSEIKNGYNSLA